MTGKPVKPATSRVGTIAEQVFPIAGSEVPLRPGRWLVVSEARNVSTHSAFVSIFLGLVEDARLKEGTRIISLISDSDRDRYPRMKQFPNQLYNVTDSNEANASQARWQICNMLTQGWNDLHDKTTGISETDSATARELQIRGISVPPQFLVAQFVRREPGRALEAHYYIDVADVIRKEERNPVHWRESPFAPMNIRQYPRKFERYREIVSWATAWWPGYRKCYESFKPAGLW